MHDAESLAVEPGQLVRVVEPAEGLYQNTQVRAEWVPNHLPEDVAGTAVLQHRGFGIAARQIREKSEVVDALKEMIAHPGPYVLDVLIPYQEHVLPMIPSGGTVRDIIKS